MDGGQETTTWFVFRENEGLHPTFAEAIEALSAEDAISTLVPYAHGRYYAFEVAAFDVATEHKHETTITPA